MYTGHLVKYPLCLSHFNETLNFLGRFWKKKKKIQILHFMKIPPVGVPCGRWTDMGKLIVTFCNFAKAPKNSTFCLLNTFMCLEWISGQTAITSLYSINWLVFITETECFYCAVRTGSLYIILRSAHTVYLCVLCGYENKQRLFPYTALTDWFV